MFIRGLLSSFLIAVLLQSSPARAVDGDPDPRKHPSEGILKYIDQAEVYVLRPIRLSEKSHAPFLDFGFRKFVAIQEQSLEFGLDVDAAVDSKRSDIFLVFRGGKPSEGHFFLSADWVYSDLDKAQIGLGFEGPFLLDRWDPELDTNQWHVALTGGIGRTGPSDAALLPQVQDYLYGVDAGLSFGSGDFKVRLESQCSFLAAHPDQTEVFNQSGQGFYSRFDATASCKVLDFTASKRISLSLLAGITKESLKLQGTRFQDGKPVDLGHEDMRAKLGIVVDFDKFPSP